MIGFWRKPEDINGLILYEREAMTTTILPYTKSKKNIPIDPFGDPCFTIRELLSRDLESKI